MPLAAGPSRRPRANIPGTSDGLELMECPIAQNGLFDAAISTNLGTMGRLPLPA
jgi:hypothetical protein